MLWLLLYISLLILKLTSKTCLSLGPGKIKHSENEFCGNFDLISLPADKTVPDGTFKSYSELRRLLLSTEDSL